MHCRRCSSMRGVLCSTGAFLDVIAMRPRCSTLDFTFGCPRWPCAGAASRISTFMTRSCVVRHLRAQRFPQAAKANRDREPMAPILCACLRVDDPCAPLVHSCVIAAVRAAKEIADSRSEMIQCNRAAPPVLLRLQVLFQIGVCMHQRVDVLCREHARIDVSRSAKQIVASLHASVRVVGPQRCLKPSVAKSQGGISQSDSCICTDVPTRVQCLIGKKGTRKIATGKASCLANCFQPAADACRTGARMIDNPHHDCFGMLLQQCLQIFQDSVGINGPRFGSSRARCVLCSTTAGAAWLKRVILREVRARSSQY